jgi:hypothetical protein
MYHRQPFFAFFALIVNDIFFPSQPWVLPDVVWWVSKNWKELSGVGSECCHGQTMYNALAHVALWCLQFALSIYQTDYLLISGRHCMCFCLVSVVEQFKYREAVGGKQRKAR